MIVTTELISALGLNPAEKCDAQVIEALANVTHVARTRRYDGPDKFGYQFLIRDLRLGYEGSFTRLSFGTYGTERAAGLDVLLEALDGAPFYPIMDCPMDVASYVMGCAIPIEWKSEFYFDAELQNRVWIKTVAPVRVP